MACEIIVTKENLRQRSSTTKQIEIREISDKRSCGKAEICLSISDALSDASYERPLMTISHLLRAIR